MREFVAAVGINFVCVEICFGSLGEIFVDFVAILLGKILVERICCYSRETFYGVEIFFGSLGEIFVEFVGIMLGEILFERICCYNVDTFCVSRNFWFGSSGEIFVDRL